MSAAGRSCDPRTDTWSAVESAGYQIGLIAMLLPFHHCLEEKVIHYLTSRLLLKISGKQMISKVFGKKDADVPMGNL